METIINKKWKGEDGAERSITISKDDNGKTVLYKGLAKDWQTPCCICGKVIGGFGNNARPLKKGICCDECNAKVIEERLKRMEEKK